MKNYGFTLAEIGGVPSRRGRFLFGKLTFPSPTAFFGRRGSDCRRGTSRTSTGEVRVGADCTSSVQCISPSLKFVSSLPFANKFFSLPRRDRRVAFTLAEVLITLGVIGVVAALTLPVVTSKIEKQVLRTQFMKQYRNITATRQELEAENGSVINCYLTYPPLLNDYSECESFWNNFFKKNKVIKTCNYGVEGCSPIYKSGSEVVNSGGVRNNTIPSLGDLPAKVYVLADGVLLYVPTQTWHMSNFFIDINGSKGPNKYGYDMFPMILHKNSSKLTDVPYPIFEKGGRRIKNMLLNNDDVNNSLFSE